MKTKYDILKKKPVAKFFYRGNHTHPVRRTVILIEERENHICGFEIREGMETRNPSAAPIKTFKKQKIAKIENIDKRRVLRVKTPVKQQKNTTLKRFALKELVVSGI